MGKTVVLLTTGQAPSHLRIRPNDKLNVHSIHTFEFICAEVNLSVYIRMYTEEDEQFYGPGLFPS